MQIPDNLDEIMNHSGTVGFWRDIMRFPCGWYETATQRDIYRVAKYIIDETKKEKAALYQTDIMAKFGLTENYVALIQYILANVSIGCLYPEDYKVNWQKYDVFDYGTSPRGLWGYEETGGVFLELFRRDFKKHWDMDIEEEERKDAE